MSEYLIQKSTLVSIADPVRELSGETGELSPAQIAVEITEANTEVEVQEALLDEIIAMLPIILPPIGTPLNDISWEDISAISQSGQAANYFSIGEAKEIIINGAVGNTTFDNLSVWAFILGFDHNSEIEGNNMIHFQIGKTAQTGGKDICLISRGYGNNVSVAGYFNMNHSLSNSGGWEASTMRTVLLGSNYAPTDPLPGSLMAALPSELRAVMKGCIKYSDNTGGGSDTAAYVTATTDYLWLLSVTEFLGSPGVANSAESAYQKRYAYYTNGNFNKYCHNDVSTVATWWLRSVHAYVSTGFCVFDSSEGIINSHATYIYGIAPCFCV